ncbi:MAG: hypothetical protein R6V13_05690 [Anaerolineae bacterium]
MSSTERLSNGAIIVVEEGAEGKGDELAQLACFQMVYILDRVEAGEF